MPDLAGLLQPVAAGLVTDGRLIGAASAQVMTGGGTVGVGAWKPGDTAEANRVLDGLGAGQDDGTTQAQQAAGQIAHGTRTSLARVLVEAARGTWDAAAAGHRLAAVLADAAKAVAGALGELVTAIGAAAVAWYRQQQVEWVTWETEDGNACPVCLADEATGPVPFGEPFDGGDISPPSHPNCRCCLTPARAPRAAQQPAPAAEGQPAAEPAPAEPETEPGETPPFEPLQFTTGADADEWLKDHRPSLAAAQREAVEWYAGSGSGMVNRRLRQGTALPEDALGVNVKAEVAALDSAMSPLPAGLVLDRVVGADAFGGEDKLAGLAGKVISDQAYQSASLGGTSLGRQGVVMHIGAPEGTPAVVIGNKMVAGEREILLARGTRLAVSRVEETGGRWHLWAMVIPE